MAVITLSEINLYTLNAIVVSSLNVSSSLWPHGLHHTRLPCPTLLLGVFSNSCLSSCWCHPTISSLVALFSACPQSFPASGSFLMSRLFTSGGQSIGVSGSASVLQWTFRVNFIYDWLVWSPCCPRDCQESSPEQQFESIYSLALSFLYGPALTSVHDYRECW